MTPKIPFPEDVSRSQPIGPTRVVGEDTKVSPSTSFQSYMQQPANPLTKTMTTTATQSPFDLAHGQGILPSGPNVDTLLAQINSARGTMGDVHDLLQTPNLKLKRSSKYLLKNKLSDAKAHLHAASAKMGSKEVAEEPVSAGSGPIDKFLAYVTDGQNQLEAAKRHLQQLKDTGGQLNPADLLLIQIKLNKAQQELEYSSVLLSKAVDDMKMIFNIQL
ncbi:MAG: hypothetical protein ACM3JI_01110 [Anaerolineae bacterium]